MIHGKALFTSCFWGAALAFGANYDLILALFTADVFMANRRIRNHTCDLGQRRRLLRPSSIGGLNLICITSISSTLVQNKIK